jgi:hypothetical protein
MATIGFLVPTLPLRCRGRTSGWILVALRVLRDLVSAESGTQILPYNPSSGPISLLHARLAVW